LTNGCAWNAVSAFANCGRAVAHVRGSYGPRANLLCLCYASASHSRNTRTCCAKTSGCSVRARPATGAAQRGVYLFFFDGDVADLRRPRPLGLFKSFTRGGHFVRFFELLTEPPHVVLLSESSDATRAEYDRFGGVGIPMLCCRTIKTKIPARFLLPSTPSGSCCSVPMICVLVPQGQSNP